MYKCIVKKNLLTKKTVYEFNYKENAVNCAKKYIRIGYWVKIRVIMK